MQVQGIYAKKEETNLSLDKIKASVIIPVCKSDEYVQSCIGSVLAQSLRDFELICIDCGTTDNNINKNMKS